jgi:tetratricopeptide (TPR) repeat protein
MTTEANKAAFISYASDDREAALRICESLRNAGIEVWFDLSELRGGDAWDASIRKQIKYCALFLPIISKNTRARQEGYFRLEWKLAVDRSHLMSQERTFLLPVAIDNTLEDSDNLPDRFKEVQWVRLLDGNIPSSFIDRVQRLLAGAPAAGVPISAAPLHPTFAKAEVRSRLHSRSFLLSAGAFVLAILAAAGLYRYQNGHAGPARESAIAQPSAATAKIAGFSPPEHSIAVMPFANMSGGRRALALNPLSPGAWSNSAAAFLYIGLYEESIRAADHTASLGSSAAQGTRCQALLALGKQQEALAACQPADDATKQAAMAVLLNKLNRQSEAQAMLDQLVKENGDAAAYQYAGIYAQWGDKATALKWIEKGYELKDPGLAFMKADPVLEPIRREPRFLAVVSKLIFPD